LQRAISKAEGQTDNWGLISRSAELGLFRPRVKFAECPIKSTMGVLGRKWTLLILRDIGFRKIDRFNRLLESIRGLTPRVLSMRLRELEEGGYIKCVEDRESPMVVRWALTEKGTDTLPILLRLIAFGSKWYPDEVFDDKKPRRLTELFRPEAVRMIEGRT